ncbi:MAG: N-acetyltransferase [Lachnospiraceae bacterium]|nr:N-acetyltransferase [Lachnospiraceae bacterium]
MIRTETVNDYRAVETLTREAFWNVNVPGCDEHYIAHILRDHEDFIPELDLVAELDGQIVGNVMYTKSKLIDEAGNEKRILTFGPISVLPAFQRKGISRALLEASFAKAVEMEFDVIVIFGNPDNYVARGFKSCKKYNVCVGDGVFPTAMLVKELQPGALDGRKWFYHESPAYEMDSAEAEKFDALFEFKEKKWQPSQEEFFIHSSSVIQ